MDKSQRDYKGYTISRKVNGQTGCPGNFQSAKYYEVSREGRYLFTAETLTKAKEVIDHKPTEESRRMVANLRKQLIEGSKS